MKSPVFKSSPLFFLFKRNKYEIYDLNSKTLLFKIKNIKRHDEYNFIWPLCDVENNRPRKIDTALRFGKSLIKLTVKKIKNVDFNPKKVRKGAHILYIFIIYDN